MLLRPTVYAQFVAGENESEISQSMEKMSLLGMRPMLAVPIEEDLGESTGYDLIFCQCAQTPKYFVLYLVNIYYLLTLTKQRK